MNKKYYFSWDYCYVQICQVRIFILPCQCIRIISFLPVSKLKLEYYRLEKEILDRYLEVVLKGNRDGLKVKCSILPRCMHLKRTKTRKRTLFLLYVNVIE